MSAPTVNASLAGKPLGALRTRLQGLADAIYRSDPTLGASSILALAVSAFRLMAKIQRGRWTLRRLAILSGGAGAIVPVRRE